MNWLTKPNVCPGLFYGTPAQDGFLIRIRTPDGLLNHQQGRAIATLVEQWGSEAIQATNRANLQIRSVQENQVVQQQQIKLKFMRSLWLIILISNLRNRTQ